MESDPRSHIRNIPILSRGVHDVMRWRISSTTALVCGSLTFNDTLIL
jgi:hypothetical protein